jgi:asparagine synthase (glutamine-hydrolysing)
MLRLSRAIAGTPARVFLTGDGGDDLFLGYPRHRLLLQVERAARRMPDGLASAWRAVRGVVPRVGPLKRAVHLADYLSGGLGAYVAANPGLEDFRAHGLLGPRLADHARPGLRWSIESARHVLTEYLEHDRATQFVSEYLVKVDGASMHYGLEARSPFLDQEMWEFAGALPYGRLLHGGELKAVLRELARRKLGPAVAHAPKRGFTVPVEDWMGRRWHRRVADSLSESLLVADGWISQPAVTRELAESVRTGRASRRLWYLWVLEEWLRTERGSLRAGGEAVALSRSA